MTDITGQAEEKISRRTTLPKHRRRAVQVMLSDTDWSLIEEFASCNRRSLSQEVSLLIEKGLQVETGLPT